MSRPLHLAWLVLVAGTADVAPSIRLESSLDGQPPAAGWAYARAGQVVTLSAVLTPEVPGARYEWFQLEPVKPYVDNTTPSFHFEPVGYQAVEIERCRGARTCRVDAEARRFSGYRKVPGTGVMAYQVRATLPDGTTVQTPGPEAATGWGLPLEVMRVVFRKDDTYLGYLTELFNTPYIFGSSSDGSRHQTDRLVGSDCADLAVYGLRRLGQRVEYTSSFNIHRVGAKMVGRLDSAAGQVKAQPGDILHFPDSRHVAVLYEDREPLGRLDENDLMLHTCWAPVTLVRIGDGAQCFSYPVRVFRPANAANVRR